MSYLRTRASALKHDPQAAALLTVSKSETAGRVETGAWRRMGLRMDGRQEPAAWLT